jgi:hypothetical protein
LAAAATAMKRYGQWKSINGELSFMRRSKPTRDIIISRRRVSEIRAAMKRNDQAMNREVMKYEAER